MNTMNSKKAHNIVLLCNVILLWGISSCSSRENNEITTDETGKTAVYINTVVAENESIISTANASSGKVAAHVVPEIIAREKMVYGNIADALISMERASVSLKNTTASTSKSVIAPINTVTMEPGKLFIVKLFNDNNGIRGTEYGTYTLTAGQPGSIKVDSGKKYHWIAYSTNETSLPAIAGNIISADNMINKDILYDSGVLMNTETGNNNYLEIVFKHKASRFQVLVNSQGMYMPMMLTKGSGEISIGQGTGNAFNSLLRTRSFDISTGEYANTAQLVNEVPLADTNFTNALKTVYIYSSDEVTNIPANTLVVKVNNILFKADHMPTVYPGEGIWGWTTPVYFNINNDAFDISHGIAYKITAKLIQSGIRFGNATWSRGILTDAPSISTLNNILKYRIVPFNKLEANNEHNYWTWNSLLPAGDAASVYNEINDPCMQLYPYNIWRMPTATEAKELADLAPVVSAQGLLQPSESEGYKSWFNMNITPDPSGAHLQYFYGLKIQFSGYKDASGNLLESKSDINNTTITSITNAVSARFWTKESAGNTARAFVRYADIAPAGGQNVSVTVPNKGSIANMDKSSRLNIRCVRN